MQRYAGLTVKWLITNTGLIFREAPHLVLYTPKGGYDAHWHSTERDSTWQPVAGEDTLQPTIYEVFSPSPVLSTNISLRRMSSRTSTKSKNRASTFCSQITSRDQYCVITQATYPVTASHCLPKRMGDDTTREIFRVFAPTEHALYGPTINVFHPSLGFLTVKNLDNFIKDYSLGLFCLDAVSRHLNTDECITYNLDF